MVQKLVNSVWHELQTTEPSGHIAGHYRVTFLCKHACSAEVAGTKTYTILGGKFVTQTNGTYVTRTLDNPHADNQDSFGLASSIARSQAGRGKAAYCEIINKMNSTQVFQLLAYKTFPKQKTILLMT